MGTAKDATGVEAVVGEDARCEIARFPHLADGENRLGAVQLAKARAEFGEWDVYRSWNRMTSGAGCRADVHHLRAGIG